MIRVRDAEAGSYVTVRLARPGVLRISAQVPGATDSSDLSSLRVLLVADLLGRAAELRGLQRFTAWVCAGPSADSAEALNIHPPASWVGAGEATLPADVYVTSDDTPASDAIDVRVAVARLRALVGPDPLEIRLALMSGWHEQPAAITEDELAEARDELGRWRYRVAEWAESPSRPVPQSIAAAARDAFDGLDTATVLGMLRDLAADDDIPPGAKFETFVYADRVLGLDLARDIGRVSFPGTAH